MKALIFGAGGQDGFYLTELLKRRQVDVTGISRSCGGLTGDVADRNFVESLIAAEKPDYIFHLAANSTTRHDALFDNHAAISTGTINILEAAYRHSRQSRIFLSGSAVQFENTGTPIDEQTPFAPLSPYAVSRIHSVYAARYYRSLGLKTYVGYFFNHDSPRRTERHINQKIAAAARQGEKMEIGDLTVRKEFNYAGDAVEAAWLLVSQDNVFEAVIGSGEAHSIEEWLNFCYAVVGRDWRDYVTIKKDFTAEYQILVSNPARLKALGWEPKINIEQLAKMMMEDFNLNMAETLGTLSDKLTIVKLKQYHTEDETRLASLTQQEAQLQTEIDEFVKAAFEGRIPPERLTFSANKVYKKEGNEMQEIKGSLGEIFSLLAETNCRLWHVQEKVYEFEAVPAEEKDAVVKDLAIINLERNQCIDEMDKTFLALIAGSNG